MVANSILRDLQRRWSLVFQHDGNRLLGKNLYDCDVNTEISSAICHGLGMWVGIFVAPSHFVCWNAGERKIPIDHISASTFHPLLPRADSSWVVIHVSSIFFDPNFSCVTDLVCVSPEESVGLLQAWQTQTWWTLVFTSGVITEHKISCQFGEIKMLFSRLNSNILSCRRLSFDSQNQSSNNQSEFVLPTAFRAVHLALSWTHAWAYELSCAPFSRLPTGIQVVSPCWSNLISTLDLSAFKSASFGRKCYANQNMGKYRRRHGLWYAEPSPSALDNTRPNPLPLVLQRDHQLFTWIQSWFSTVNSNRKIRSLAFPWARSMGICLC